MMQVIRLATRGALAALVAAALVACDNDTPTGTGVDLFPGGVTPTTLLAEFTGTDLILREDVFTGFGDPRLAPFLIAANNFDGVFNSHPIARFTDIPDSLTYTTEEGVTVNEEISGFAGGRVLLAVDSSATFPGGTTSLLLWEVGQPWDSATVTWDYAVNEPGNQVPWTTPGGTPGTFLGSSFWFPGDTVAADTVIWQLDSLMVARITQPDHPGLMITSDQPGIRIKASALIFAGDVHPAEVQDTLIEVRAVEGPQLFLHAPGPPETTDYIRTGGLTGDRTILTLDIDQQVEACAPLTGCRSLPLREVTLNRAQLIFQPVRVPGGYRPLSMPRVVLRRVSEPQYGQYAPLGGIIASDSIASAAFGTDDAAPFALDLTSAVLTLLADSTATEMSVAVITDYSIPDLGLLWFQRSPTLRLVYTLPTHPVLP